MSLLKQKFYNLMKKAKTLDAAKKGRTQGRILKYKLRQHNKNPNLR